MIGKQVLFLCLFGLVFSISHAETHRRKILQNAVDGLVQGVFTDDETADNVYQTVSVTYGSLARFSFASTVLTGGWSVSAVNASIELSTNATYAYNYASGNGTSRVNVTATLAAGSSSQAPQVTASIATVVCERNTAGNLLNSTISGQRLPALQLSAANVVSTSGDQSASMVYDELIEYEDAKSVAIFVNGTMVACQNLQPPFPDFPNDWSAVIENTDSANGTTFVLTEQYSQSMNKIRIDLHSFGANTIILADTAASSNTFINASNGSCSTRPSARRTNWITGEDNVTLLSTAELLHFSDDEFTYVPGTYWARGIACELWQANVNFSNSWVSANFTASFYFPVDQWLVNREDYHRLLKQITLVGTWNGSLFNQTISYIDFRPRTFRSPTFDVCAISPYGSNCNCTDDKRRAAFSNVEDDAESRSDDIGLTVAGDGDIQALCSEAYPVPHGFISAQSGPYVGLTIIGMIGGALITGLVFFCLSRKGGGRPIMISDPMRHQKFSPGM